MALMGIHQGCVNRSCDETDWEGGIDGIERLPTSMRLMALIALTVQGEQGHETEVRKVKCLEVKRWKR